jgi:hypothetical protein
MLLILGIMIYGFAMWLGLYLVSRNPADARLRLAGAGLVAYAFGLGLDVLIFHAAESDLAGKLATWQRPFLFLPAVFWVILLFRLVPRDMSLLAWFRRHPRPLALIAAASIFFALGLSFLFYPLA